MVNKNKKIKNILAFTVVLVVAIIAIATTESSDFDLKFAVDQNGATIEAETVTLKGKLVKLFDLYYIKGNLNIDDKSYRLKKFNKVSDRNDNLFEMVFVDSDDQEFMNGTAYLSGSIIDNNARRMYILIDKLEMKTGRSYTECIHCQIEGKNK